MAFDRLFNSLRLDADISLRDGGGAVLQEALDKGNVISIRLVNLGSVPLAEAVGADALKAQIVTDDSKLLLDRPFGKKVSLVFAPQGQKQGKTELFMVADLRKMRENQ